MFRMNPLLYEILQQRTFFIDLKISRFCRR